MMIKNILDAEEPKWKSNQKDVVWWIASLDNVKAAPQINPPCI